MKDPLACIFNLGRHEPDLNADKHELEETNRSGPGIGPLEHELTRTAVPKSRVETTCWSAGFPVPWVRLA